MCLAQKIKDYRVFSITVTTVTLFWVWEVLSLILTLIQDTTLTTSQTALATTTLAALIALVKFSYTFAMQSTDSKKP